jgi:hypothetical protein
MRGGKTKYRAEFDEIARALALEGARQEDFAAAFGVDTKTVRRWFIFEPSFNAAVLAGKRACDDAVVQAAQKRFDDLVRLRRSSSSRRASR